jgi:hypothetical protein
VEAISAPRAGNRTSPSGDSSSMAMGVRETRTAAPGTAAPVRKAAEEPGSSTAPARTARQQEPAKLPRSVIIFFDQDQSNERFPLSAAQAQVADIVRQEGYQVVSTTAASGIRNALDRGDLAGVRSHGIGYVILATASGSLEQQAAYGSTYYVAKVNVNFELVRMSDGAAAAHANGDARSRGSANASSAVSEALMTATSNGARELMRQLQSSN